MMSDLVEKTNAHIKAMEDRKKSRKADRIERIKDAIEPRNNTNDITGDSMFVGSTQKYRDNYDRIFGTKKEK